MENREIYNQNNKLYDGAKKNYKNENHICAEFTYEEHSETLVENNLQYIEFSYEEIIKFDIEQLLNIVSNRIDDLGEYFLFSNIHNALPLLTNMKVEEAISLYEKFIKQELERVIKKAKSYKETIDYKNFLIYYNLIDMLQKFEHDLLLGKISIAKEF